MSHGHEPSVEFRDELVALIPHMRAFARSLCGGEADGDDLAQDALAKAWSCHRQYAPGTNLKAWVFTIERNLFYSSRRRSRRQAPLDQETLEQTLVAVNDPFAGIELDELRRAMAMLPDDQREALILIGAAGLSYEEASEICGVPVGTVKSRVSRARDRLALIYAEGGIIEDEQPAHQAMALIFSELDSLRLARCA